MRPRRRLSTGPSVADTTLETVIESLVTKLGTAVAGTRWEPDAVKAVLFWPDETALNSLGATTVYLVRPGRERKSISGACSIDSLLDVYILAARHVGQAGNQIQEDPPRWEVSASLAADVLGKLLAAEDARVAPVVAYMHSALEVDHEWDGPWVIPELHFTLRYRHEKSVR